MAMTQMITATIQSLLVILNKSVQCLNVLRLFNETPVNPRKCTAVLAKILFLLNQGEVMSLKSLFYKCTVIYTTIKSFSVFLHSIGFNLVVIHISSKYHDSHLVLCMDKNMAPKGLLWAFTYSNIVRLLHLPLISQVLGTTEATETFFAITKLFQVKIFLSNLKD